MSEFMGKPLNPISIDSEPKSIINIFEDTIKEYEAYIKNAGLTQDPAKKSSFTGSATAVSGEKIAKMQVSSVSKALEGAAAGVQAVSYTHLDVYKRQVPYI